jgi:hypothetical protein
MQQQLGRGMVKFIGMHGFEESHFIRHFRKMGQVFRQPGP